MNSRLKNFTEFFLFLLLFFSFLTGCSSIPKSKNMIAERLVIEKKHGKSVHLNVVGGGESETFFVSNIEFQKAVKASIAKSDLFSAVTEEQKSDYRLDIFLGDLKQTFIGMNMETIMEVVWNLSDVKTQKTIWQSIVTTSYTATTKDAFSGAERFKIATEKAARKNIEKGLERMSKAKLIR